MISKGEAYTQLHPLFYRQILVTQVVPGINTILMGLPTSDPKFGIDAASGTGGVAGVGATGGTESGAGSGAGACPASGAGDGSDLVTEPDPCSNVMPFNGSGNASTHAATPGIDSAYGA